jgi:TonB family protein
MLDWTLVVLGVVLDASLRATLLAGVVFVLLVLFAVRSPHVRHTVWLGVLLAMLLMPGLRLLLPDLPVPMGSWAAISAGTALPLTFSLRWVTDEEAIDENAANGPGSMSRVQGDETRRAVTPTWLVALVTVYPAGVLLFGVKLLRGWAGAARVARSARRVHDAAGAESVPVFESPRVITPVTMGMLRPRILLPATWRTWMAGRIDAVLAHERAHAARRDPLIALVAQVNRTVFWFHPVAWWLERALSASAEEVCDAAGVQAVGRREHYAEVLLEFARDVQRHGGRLGWHGSGVAGLGSLMQRIDRVLAHDAVPRVSRTRTIAAAACCLAAGCFVAAVEGRVTAGPDDDIPNESVALAKAAPHGGASLRPEVSPVAAATRPAQAPSGSIEGVVLDPSGLPIPDVDVTLSALSTEIVQRTDARGRYAFINLTQGTYRLQIQLPGFKTLTRPRVLVTTGMQTLGPAVLEVGSVAESITIRADVSGAARPVSQPSLPAESRSAESAERLAADAERVSRRVQEAMRARQAASASSSPQTGGDIAPPLKVRDMPPVFPPGAVGGGGTVILEGTIGTDGQVQNARVLRGVRDTPAFDHAALSALEQWRYAPALLNGSPVEVVVTVTMNFTSR